MVFAPTRRDTLGEFGQLVEGYDEQVWDLHLKVSETPVHYRVLYIEKGKLSSLLISSHVV
uniref:Uncharacterized protein n=1 Tax=Salmo trutta TaxID=8032 RepID=A0A674C5Q1_SALTR